MNKKDITNTSSPYLEKKTKQHVPFRNHLLKSWEIFELNRNWLRQVTALYIRVT
jgi:hypothetical protein